MSVLSPREHRDIAGDIHAWLGGRKKAWLILLVALVLVAWAGHWLYYRITHLHIDDARISRHEVDITDRVMLIPAWIMGRTRAGQSA